MDHTGQLRRTEVETQERVTELKDILGKSIMGQFWAVRQGDQEAMASRVTFELDKRTASAVREERFRQEYARQLTTFGVRVVGRSGSMVSIPRAKTMHFSTNLTWDSRVGLRR